MYCSQTPEATSEGRRSSRHLVSLLRAPCRCLGHPWAHPTAPRFREPNPTAVSWAAAFPSRFHWLYWQEAHFVCLGTAIWCHFRCCMKLLQACRYGSRKKNGFPVDPVFYLPAPQENLQYLKQHWRPAFRQLNHFLSVCARHQVPWQHLGFQGLGLQYSISWFKNFKTCRCRAESQALGTGLKGNLPG